ncbi:dipicolinic acid synthetase subunit A [Bacillus piscicola]|uniref:dipicolinic acid synthetase subunit A n=1 Tax=Bacillus piscicola TaxID=1632684 RepID=UPI001F091910|nr:dipicolinic acid synthetase subunit A [Bacillus piscicola]
MDKKAVIIGGDARQVEIALSLREAGVTVFLIGFDRWNREEAGIVKVSGNGDVPWSQIDAILLPVSGLKKGNTVEAQFSSMEIVLEEAWVQQTKESCLLMTGIQTEQLEKVTVEWKRRWIKLLERDDVAIYNSVPSAEGTLLMALRETNITIHRSNTVVLGLGRTGLTIAHTFSALGAYVKVGTAVPAEKARAQALGMETFDLGELNSIIESADICINTIPAPVLKEETIVQMPSHCLIIDVASYPGGTDFKYAKQRGIKALLAPGLPGAVAPKTAGQILANVITQLLAEQGTTKEDGNAVS